MSERNNAIPYSPEQFARDVAQILDEHVEASDETSHVTDIGWAGVTVTVTFDDGSTRTLVAS